ncbi:MAG TPA: hypothetical protein VN806_07465 [Caulobacteraceae bacterium]|nr:hypothetical protein [Caulobacteraceae bacterium]
MTPSPPDEARKVVRTLPDDISAMVLSLAQAKLSALQLSGSALDQRCTQAASFELAAAAVAGALLATDNASIFTRLFAALAAIAFVSAACFAFGGVRAGKQHLPGINASWWAPALETKDFDLKIARGWAADYYEKAIIFNVSVDKKRSSALDSSLLLSILAGVFVSLAALSRLAG